MSCRDFIWGSSLSRREKFTIRLLLECNSFLRGEWRLFHRSLSTVGPMEEQLEKFTAVNDVDGDIHLVRTTSMKTTLCGMAAAESSTREVTCYRCHEFAVGI
jgi:hypothetical protein